MPTWTGNILRTFKVYREKSVQSRNSELTAECGCMITYNINQLLGLSGLWATDSAAPAPPYFFKSRSRSSGFRARSAPLPLRSYALPTSSHYLYCSSKIWLLQVNFDTKQILEMSRKVPDNDIFIGTWMLAAVFIITIIILITMNNLCDICMHVFASVA